MEIEATQQLALSEQEASVLEQLMYDTRLSNKFTRTDGGTQTGPSGVSLNQQITNVLAQNYGITDLAAVQRIMDAYYAAKQSNSPAAVNVPRAAPSAPAFEIANVPDGATVKPDALPELAASHVLAV